MYIAQTDNMDLRLIWHNRTSTKRYTLRLWPWIVAIEEKPPSRVDAIQRGKSLKGGQGRAWIWEELKRRGFLD